MWTRSALALLIAFPALMGAQTADFVRDVQPIFEKRCIQCHGGAAHIAGLRLDDRDAALKGSDRGPVIQPGNAAGSRLIVMVTGAETKFMPPSGPHLTAEEVQALRSWIDAGAKWPDSARSLSVKARPKLWSLQPITHPGPPSVKDRAWPANDIDRFILSRLEAESIAPAPPADRITLIRRVSLDLTGLPPTAAEVAAFVNDTSAGAYERVVDRLLGSPHYGERWAREWLDLAHYADSDGFEKDLVRPAAWRYRQWVIDALNQNLPYDRFTIEQLAGDEMPDATVETRVATGFLRNTLTNREAGTTRESDRYDQLVDRTGTVGTTWLGLTVRCAQCHTHKYDPILHTDYYSLFAFFDRAREVNIDAPMPGEIGPYLEAVPEYARKREALLVWANEPALQIQWEHRIAEAIQDPGKDTAWDFEVTQNRVMVDNFDRLTTHPESRSPRESEILTDYFLHNFGPANAKDKVTANRLKAAAKAIDDLNAHFPRMSEAMTVADDPAPHRTFTHPKGDYKNNAVEVVPNTPSFLPPMAKDLPRNRLGLAKWLVSAENPLTARVAVNRYWQELFGQGLVSTSDDFGTQGSAPSHPELLDWLASDFRDHGWDTKRLIREIVLSATYRQSSHGRPELETKDPANVLLARQSAVRLPAESIRDEALAVSGLLNPAIGGKSVRPPQPAGIAELGYGGSVKWPESAGMDRYRRGLYIHYQRTTPYPFLGNFDEPDSVLACTRRRTSDTALQALNLLNDPVFYEAAQALAFRLERESAPAFETRLDYAYRLCFGRDPSASERERLAAYFNTQPTDYGWTGVARILLNTHEFITRE